MEADHFDRLARMVRAGSRRAFVTTLAGTLLGAGLGGSRPTEIDARRRDRRRRRRRRRSECDTGQIRCGRRCCQPDQVCRRGRCRGCRNGSECLANYAFQRPVCVEGHCEQCGTDADCDFLTDGQFPACDGNVCLECRLDSHCPQPTPFCHNNACLECVLDAHCLSGFSCRGNRCVDDCANGDLDGDESDVDCGGSCPDRCANGQGCFQDADCQSGFCDNGRCAPREVCMSNADCDAQQCLSCASGYGCWQPCPTGKLCVIGEDGTYGGCCNPDKYIAQWVSRISGNTGYICCPPEQSIEDCCTAQVHQADCFPWDNSVVAP